MPEYKDGWYWVRDLGCDDEEWTTCEVAADGRGAQDITFADGETFGLHEVGSQVLRTLTGPIPTPDDPRWKALVGG